MTHTHTHTKHYLAKSTLMQTPACTPKHIFPSNVCGIHCDKGRWYLIIIKIIKLRFNELITLVSLPYKKILIPKLFCVTWERVNAALKLRAEQ